VSEALRHLPDPTTNEKTKKLVVAGGSKFEILRHGPTGTVAMNWNGGNEGKPSLPQQVLDHCANTYLTGADNQNKILKGFTEHNRENSDGDRFKFRAHPSYRSSAGQNCDVWYDWANFKYVETDANGNSVELVAPAQIMCFLQLGPEFDGNLTKEEPYALVRSFREEASEISYCSIAQQGQLDDSFYVYPCASIDSPAAVVPNLRSPDDNEMTKYFVLKNRSFWLSRFHRELDEISQD
jgi:hypothetical protein